MVLPLEAEVFGPFDEKGEVSLGLDVLTWPKLSSRAIRENALIPRSSTEQRILLCFGGLDHMQGGCLGVLACCRFCFGPVSG